MTAATSTSAGRAGLAGLTRIVPQLMRNTRRPLRPIERNVLYYRRNWLILASGFFEPLFYLLSIRIGLGKLVGDVNVGGRTIDYATFVAPALMASSAMNGAVYDSTMNVFHKLRYAHTYDAMLAAPLGAGDVALGEIGWALIRGQLYSIMFLLVMAIMGMTSSWWALAALPACFLLGLAFASIGMAATTYMRGWSDFEWVPTISMPLFLFSATFYPASIYGSGRWALQLSPLYHGVSLVRAANEGVASWSLLGHIAVLATISMVCIVIVARRLERLLLS